jgi:H+/Cl- antiporter ClcA
MQTLPGIFGSQYGQRVRMWKVGVMLAVLGGVVSGVLAALFLGLLERVNHLFQLNPILVVGLPIAGCFGYVIFSRYGLGVEAGTSLILQVFHGRRETIPFRMAPMVLWGTLVSHLFGGSVGREGTAVQMSVGAMVGGSRWMGIGTDWNRTLVACGIAGGFGAVFGTPWAGAMYAVEMPVFGVIQWRYVPFCIISSQIGNWVCMACGVEHSDYPEIGSVDYTSIVLWFKLGAAGCVFGCCARFFIGLTRGVGRILVRIGLSGISQVLVISCAVALLGTIGGMQGYLGLGAESLNPALPSLLGSFSQGGVSGWSWLWKLVFTALTLAAGFRGGEVTPLFFVGAAIGNCTANLLGCPVDYLAALGMAAVFFGACHSPIAGCIMGIELFGIELAAPLFLVCLISDRVCSGISLYPDQLHKSNVQLEPPLN